MSIAINSFIDENYKYKEISSRRRVKTRQSNNSIHKLSFPLVEGNKFGSCSLQSIPQPKIIGLGFESPEKLRSPKVSFPMLIEGGREHDVGDQEHNETNTIPNVLLFSKKRIYSSADLSVANLDDEFSPNPLDSEVKNINDPCLLNRYHPDLLSRRTED